MSVKLKPTSQIITKLGIQPNGPVHAYFTERCKDYMTRFVPKDNGDLRGEVELEPGRIVYTQKYARYQYYGVREDGSHVVRNYTTPGTGPYWDKRMVSAYMPIIEEEVRNFIKKGYR